MKIIFHILILLLLNFSLSFTQELTNKQIEYRLQENTPSNYQKFLETWNKIPKESVVWEEHRITGLEPYSQNNSEGRFNVIRIHPEIPGLYFAGTSTNGIWKSVDFGQSWEYLTINNYNFGTTDIEISGKNKDQILIISGDDKIQGISKSKFRGLYFSNNLGNSFTEISLDNLDAIPVDIIPFENTFLIATENEIFQLGENLELLKIPINADLSGQKIYTLVNYDNKSFGITCRENLSDGSIYYFADIQNNIFEIRDKYENIESQVRFVPSFYFDNESGFITRILEIANTNQPNLVEIEFNSENQIITEFDMPEEFIKWQGEYNHALFTIPVDPDVIYGGGIYNYYSTDGGDNWTRNQFGMHVDLHDITFDEFTNEVFAATDGGIYSQKLGDTTWSYRSKGITAGQYFWGDVSGFNPNEFVGGKMDNGTFYRFFDEQKAIAGGDGMWCHFSDTKDSVIFVSAQNSRLGRYNTEDTSLNVIFFDTLNTIRKPWQTRYEEFGDSIWLYQDDIWFNNTSTWTNLTKHNDSVRYAERFENVIYYVNQKGELFSLENDKIIKLNFVDPLVSINDMLINDSNLILINSNENSDQIFKFDLIENKLKNSYIVLPGLTLNCIESYLNYFLIGTDDGVFRINESFDLESMVNLYDNDIPIRGIKRLVAKPNYGYIFAFTYGQDLRKLRINSCADKKIVTNLSDNIYKCPEVSIEFKIENISSNSNYRLNDGTLVTNANLKKEGTYYFLGQDENCLFTSDRINLINYDVPKTQLSLNSLTNYICEDTELILQLNSTSDIISSNITWSTGEKGAEIQIDKPGEYWAEYLTEDFCLVRSDTLEVLDGRDKFYQPALSYASGNLFDENGKALNWFLNGEIYQREKSSIELKEFGEYQAIYLNDTCSVWSEKYIHTPTGEINITGNPGNSELGVDILIDMQSEYYVEIANIEGKIVLNKKYDKKGYNYIKLNASKLASGQYFLTLRGKSVFKTQKFIILN